MILIDENMLSKGLLCEIFLELGNKILERGYTDEEKELLIAQITETPATNEREEKFIKSAIAQVEAATFIDYDRMIEKYLPLYQAMVGTYKGIDVDKDNIDEFLGERIQNLVI